MNSSINLTVDNDPLIGTLLDGRYLVNFRIARGGMGNIYQAHDVRSGRVVALKMLRSEYNADPLILQRFLREAEVLKMLSHPNICEILDIGSTQDGIHFFAMEYIEGKALDALLAQKKVIEPVTAIRYMIQVASALCEAHNKGIIHRDLKPANIIILKNGSTGEFVKLIDFGVAKLQSPDPKSMGRLTNAGSTLGTPFYMSPEQIQGADVDGRSDIYALGIILWECLFGTPPYTGTTLIDVFSAAVNLKLPKLPKQLRRDPIWKEIYAVLKKSLAKNRNSRYATMLDFQRALEALDAKIRTRTHMLSNAVCDASLSTPHNLAVFSPRRIGSLLSSISPVRLAIIGATSVITIGSIIACIVFIVPHNISTPPKQVDTYKFFSDASSDIQIGKTIVGKTPMSVDIEEEPPFSVVIKNEDSTYSFPITEHQAEISGFAVNMKHYDRRTGMLDIQTTPPGAYAETDNHKSCITPCKIDITSLERVRLRITLDGYRSENIIVIPNGGSITVRTNLFR